MPADVTLEDLGSVGAHSVYGRLRAHNPVVWLPALEGWLVTGRDAAIVALRDADTFTVDDERFSTAIVVGRSMLSTDGDEHVRHRAPFVAPFARTAVASAHAESTTATAQRLAHDLVPQRRAELRTELAGPLAVAVIARALSLVEVNEADVLGWYRAIVAGVDRVSTGQSVEAITDQAVASLRSCVEATAALAGPLHEAAEVLSSDEVFSNTAVLMFGAIETSEAITANAVWHLLTEPCLVDVIRQNRQRVGDLIEESLRLEPAAAVVDRYATRDVQLAGAAIGSGDFVRISLAGANRDPSMFVEPDRFDLDRPNARQHLAFVQGPHVCLGMHLARTQAAAAINAVLDQLVDLELDPDFLEPPSGLIFRKPRRLQARW